MRYLFGFLCVCALGAMPLVGCSDTQPACETDCNDDNECTNDVCDSASRTCSNTPVEDGTACDFGEDRTTCLAGVCCGPFNCPCRRPLDDYCESSACPTWEQAIAAAEQHAVQHGCDCGMWPVDFGAGRCGDLRYVREDCGDEYIEYFDASGTLVAAHWWTDFCGFVCPGSCSVDYGFRPACELEQEQDFCAQLPVLVCRDWCTNEPQGSSCYQGPPELVQDCYEDCLESYSKEEEQSGCGIAWIRIKSCALRSECELASPSSCDWSEDHLAHCQANSYCEANCPTQDRWECIEQYLAEGVCDVGAFELEQ